ncbi:MAG: ATP-binding response regulator [Erythrobacter sp.]
MLTRLGLVSARDAERRCDALQAEIARLETELAEAARAREAAEAANEAKTRFLASVSHEIRSPLNSIYGYAQLLERGDGKGAAKAAKVIRRSSEHLSNLVEGLLDIAQVESGALRLSRDTIRFHAFLEQVIDMLEPQAAAKGLALVLDQPPGLPEFVRTDQKRLRQVLINLLSNAIKFTDHGQVTLKVHYRNEVATFEVADTGIGIAPDDIERIFAPFERAVGDRAAPERAGIGLGLAITQALVQIMGGDIRVASIPGEGSRFTVRLMLSKPLVPPADPPVSRQLNNYLGHVRRVLVIDDDTAHLDMLRGLLEPHGLRVLTASDGASGLALAEQMQPDLVLLDVSLGGDNGWQIAHNLRERHGEMLRIVMLSGEADMAGTVAAGAGKTGSGKTGVAKNAPAQSNGPANDLFVTKPFNFDALLDVLAQQLGLEWAGPKQSGTVQAAAAAPLLPPALAAKVRPQLARIAELVRIGHARGIEAEIDAIAAADPAAAGLAIQMRTLLDNFDLAALAALAHKAGQP